MAHDDARALSEIAHVLKRPANYVGGVTTEEREDWVWDESEKAMKFKKTLYNQGLIKTIFEVIDNAVDQCSIAVNPTTTIAINMDDTTVTVKNNGAGIPIVKKDIGNGVVAYTPTTLFGTFRAGTKFHEEREGTIGMNGLGVKLTNVLSNKFSITCHDSDKNKLTQTWTDHMRKVGNPKVIKVANEPKYTTMVTFEPDLSYYTDGVDGVAIKTLKDIEDAVCTKLVHVSVSHPKPIKIYFNGRAIKCHDLKAYMKLFTTDRTFHDKVNDRFEYGVSLSTTGSFEHESFVNCQRMTSAKSNETKYVTSKIVAAISDYLKKQKNAVRLTGSQISNYLFVFVNIRVKNPDFRGQVKEELSNTICAKEYPIDIAKVMGLVKKSGLLKKLEDELSQKALSSMNDKLAGTKSNNVRVDKLDDAIDAGTARSGDTTLFLVEGDSAKTMVTTGMSVIGTKKYGVFPLKGKLLNVIGAGKGKIEKNAEIVNICKIVGLDPKKSYETPAERKTLRYGNVCTLTDADVDGNHITGLLLTFFNQFWPALVRAGFLTRFVTPIIKITKGTSVHRFFTEVDYKKFAAENNMSGWTVKHLKGLGTSAKPDTMSYFKAMDQFHVKKLVANEETSDMIKHVFDPKESNWRKDWLIAPMETELLDYNAGVVDINQFLNTEMHAYSMYNIKRAIPSAIDGLKVSQRKVMCLALERFNNPGVADTKVEQLASMVAIRTNYAHGGTSLENTITGMAQSFAGANNVPLLTEDGGFGSRRQNGADAASARYTFTKLTPHARDLFKNRSDNVLSYLTEENVVVEPCYYVPTMPLALINGTNGIATGFRTLTPSFNPSDIAHNTLQKLHKTTNFKKLVPWYGPEYKTNDRTSEDDKSWVFEGQIRYDENTRKIHITEIPIGISIDAYNTKVLQPMIDKGVIRKVDVMHKDNDPHFVIHGYVGPVDNLLTTFNLYNTMTKSCMNLLDDNGVIRNFKTPEDIFEFWYEHRRLCVDAHHKEGIRIYKYQIDELLTKYNFVKAIVDGTVSVNKRKTIEVVDDMVSARVSTNKEHIKKLLHTMSLSSLTVERYEELKSQYEKKKQELVSYEKLTVDDFIRDDVSSFLSKKRTTSDENGPPTKKRSL